MNQSPQPKEISFTDFTKLIGHRSHFELFDAIKILENDLKELEVDIKNLQDLSYEEIIAAIKEPLAQIYTTLKSKIRTLPVRERALYNQKLGVFTRRILSNLNIKSISSPIVDGKQRHSRGSGFWNDTENDPDANGILKYES